MPSSSALISGNVPLIGLFGGGGLVVPRVKLSWIGFEFEPT